MTSKHLQQTEVTTLMTVVTGCYSNCQVHWSNGKLVITPVEEWAYMYSWCSYLQVPKGRSPRQSIPFTNIRIPHFTWWCNTPWSPFYVLRHKKENLKFCYGYLGDEGLIRDVSIASHMTRPHDPPLQELPLHPARYKTILVNWYETHCRLFILALFSR